MSSNAAISFVAGDIGGTNCRLQLIKLDPSLTSIGGGEVLVAEHYYPSKDFKSAEAALEKFLKTYCEASLWPTACCLAVAGPIISPNVANVTNLKWIIDGGVISKLLNIKHVAVINDFVGIGYGLLALGPADVYHLNPGVKPVDKLPKACIGAGTGLGECYLTHNGKDYDVWASEGGHTDFAARTPLEYRLMEYIKQAEKLDRVSCERAISGLGLFHIYHFLVKEDRENSAKTKSDIRYNVALNKTIEASKDPNAIISQAAVAGSCALCVQTMDLFMNLYGAEAGNLAIKTLPFGGLYIAGGIGAKNMQSLLRNNNFSSGFLSKGRMKSMLERVPIFVVTNQSVGLMGSKHLAKRLIRESQPTSKL